MLLEIATCDSCCNSADEGYKTIGFNSDEGRGQITDADSADKHLCRECFDEMMEEYMPCNNPT